ncbi:MAG: T9SS type A sorting domain-containing protein [Chitinophagales bacterium]
MKWKSMYLLFLFCFSSNVIQGDITVTIVDYVTTFPCDGAISIEIDGEVEDYTLSWSNGETTPNLTGLCAGSYTLTATNIYGCEIIETIEIIECAAVINADITHLCAGMSTTATIKVKKPYVGDFSYTWDNGATTKHLTNITTPGMYCVTVTDLEHGCSFYECFEVLELTDTNSSLYLSTCLPKGPPIVVNEVVTDPPTGGYSNNCVPWSYLELLITGNENCEEHIDIRRFIIDDNNGDFSKPQQLSNGNISTGHIRFKNISRWAALPVGSMIVIYNPAYNGQMNLTSDPSDSNGDGVYILPVNDSGLEGNALKPSLSNSSYSGSYTTSAKWQYLHLATQQDAIQIRYPSGEYCHGIGYGSATEMTGGPDNLRLETTVDESHVLLLRGEDPQSSVSYAPVPYTNMILCDEIPTPGRPNGYYNIQFINNLCDLVSFKTAESIGSDIPNGLHIENLFPNPFNNHLQMEYSISEASEIQIYLFDMLGRVVYQKNITPNKGKNKLQIQLDENHSNGVYQLQMQSKVGNYHQSLLHIAK